ncbi:DUF4403 family protein [Gramella sp. GC03-9]|uniref:DUF4403 family protein n=1 Tax=Christiangramia oceanisediminis TaxID=2920386 RepID=A0A9X2I254_9FLAO|nr:DUF4403 family protein [Gramella oceanisediminis]MCP9199616.1 DUF4403 family protein [Gramella oceanisediminis]
MNRTEDYAAEEIGLSIPVKISFPVLNDLLRKKLIGEIISKDNSEASGSNYAQVLDASIYSSEKEGFDLCLELDLQTLTSFFKNRRLKIFFHAAVELDIAEQQVYLKDYKAEGQTKNWLADKFLQTLVNSWMYDKLKKKMSLDLMPKIREQLLEINDKLINKLEVKDGVFMEGEVQDLAVTALQMNDEAIFISFSTTGKIMVELKKIPT